MIRQTLVPHKLQALNIPEIILTSLANYIASVVWLLYLKEQMLFVVNET